MGHGPLPSSVLIIIPALCSGTPRPWMVHHCGVYHAPGKGRRLLVRPREPEGQTRRLFSPHPASAMVKEGWMAAGPHLDGRLLLALGLGDPRHGLGIRINTQVVGQVLLLPAVEIGVGVECGHGQPTAQKR